jgi:hypothetical protein
MSTNASKLKHPDFPEWLESLPDKTMLNCKDIAGIFGFASASGVNGAARDGSFPKADLTLHGKSIWHKKTIVAEIKRRKKIIRNSCAVKIP